MAKRLVLLVIILVAAALFIQSCKAQNTSHVVGGDSLGWTIPSSASVYTTWAATQNFTVGDVLVFNYATGAHDVAQVTATAFTSCSSTSPISIQTIGPTNVTLTSTGELYFICTFGSHCNNGQKLSINVSAATSTSPSPSPSGSTTPPSPSPSPSGSSTPPSPSPSPSPSGPPTPPSPSPSPSGSPTPPPSPSLSPPSPPSPPPPPPSSAQVFAGGAALPVALLSIAVAVLY